MKIEHKMFTEIVRILRETGYTVMAETDGLYNYQGDEPVWLEVKGFARQWGSPDTPMISARKVGKKGFHPIALSWFTGKIGAEKH